MKLNLHMLRDDLRDLNVQAILPDPYHVRPISFAAYTDGTGQVKGDRLYITEVGNLRRIISKAGERVNILCIGAPDVEDVRNPNHNIAWTIANITPCGLIERVGEVFAAYNDWKEAIDSSFAESKPLRRIAEQSEALFDNPIWMWDSQLQTVFHAMDETRYAVPKKYQHYEEGDAWPIGGINAIDDTFRKAMHLTEPYILPPMFGYISLCYNLFVDGQYTATLCVDEIGKKIGDRERVLIKFLGDLMSQGLHYQAHFSKHSTFAMGTMIEKLLLHENIPASKLAASLAKKGWSADDSYTCIVARQRSSTNYPDVLLRPVGERICDDVPKTLFAIAEGSIVLIVNQSLSPASTDQACATILKRLDEKDMVMRLGVSTGFTDFASLPYFREQAEQAILLGKHHNPDERIFRFEDYFMHAVAHRLTRNSVPETMYPPGLVRIQQYDKAHGSDLEETLVAYLRNNLSMNKTAQDLFMHRNTLLSRIKKIEEVGGMDLEDSDTRLLLQIARVLA